MKLTIVGCGDAWGGAGRSHACFRLDDAGMTMLFDFGASAIVAWHRLGFSTNEIDAIAISHLHGDHFGGLPFLLLNAEFEARRIKPLLIVGPPGTRQRILDAVEVYYPGINERGWRFDLRIEELSPGSSLDVLDGRLTSFRVAHGQHVVATALRLERRGKVFAYSGDTEWTDALIDVSRDADYFVTECFSVEREVVGHLNWPTLRASLPRLTARRIAVTHMSAEARGRANEFAAAGLEVLDDGQVIEF